MRVRQVPQADGGGENVEFIARPEQLPQAGEPSRGACAVPEQPVKCRGGSGDRGGPVRLEVVKPPVQVVLGQQARHPDNRGPGGDGDRVGQVVREPRVPGRQQVDEHVAARERLPVRDDVGNEHIGGHQGQPRCRDRAAASPEVAAQPLGRAEVDFGQRLIQFGFGQRRQVGPAGRGGGQVGGVLLMQRRHPARPAEQRHGRLAGQRHIAGRSGYGHRLAATARPRISARQPTRLSRGAGES